MSFTYPVWDFSKALFHPLIEHEVFITFPEGSFIQTLGIGYEIMLCIGTCIGILLR